ncbi:S-adenosylmethionine decarboxylase [Basidiobolus meristosporus CBS 931.73]|uniref:adenosylmethionine decarboxylase n=1 Tax=Basidiobolus meristosporus CBS 931.73 TaxID=1314790 RepID=A0A1Y1YV73_9FUNG|nr:S-adenosylmethionine decarboxylase [Basidiobolus meristosporus CBS 931.73]|eukprot:ORY01866.1 S-adenosylmethionine decarboxylase [Basidiobolus meristosporus CBS 931.73]
MKLEEIAHLNSSFQPASSSEEYYTGQFEGPEKLLELWFSPSAESVRQQLRSNSSTPSLSSSPDDSSLGARQICYSPNGTSRVDLEQEFDDTYDRYGLRTVSRKVWEDMLELVHCQVLSLIKNEQVDSYLLSESSMFVYPHKLILKTCGTTTLLAAVPRIIEIASSLGLVRVWRVFYSRKSFMFPDLQKAPHRNWSDEVAYLDGWFNNGAAYTVGKTNGDHWFLYLTPPQDNCIKIEGQAPAEPAYQSLVEDDDDMDDVTVEILMTELCPKAMDKFYHHAEANQPEAGPGGKDVEKITGLGSIYDDAINRLLPFLALWNYYTIHVTPEESCSYASFETTVPLAKGEDVSESKALSQLIKQVTDVFQPGKFTVTVFNSHVETHFENIQRHHPDSVNNHSRVYTPYHHDRRGNQARSRANYEGDSEVAPPKSIYIHDIKGYRKTDRILYEFEGYNLNFAHFVRR